MKKALITGGAGFIGYHLAKKLIKMNYKVYLVDNFSRGVMDSELNDLSNYVEFIEIDLLKRNNINLDLDFDYIYHLAAVVGVNHVLKSPIKVLNNNLILLQNVLDFSKKQKKLQRFIFASTSEVYAGTLKYYGLEFPTKESTPLTITSLNDNRTSYMLSKIYGEAISLHSEIPITIIRPHNFYGPRMGLSHVIPELMKKIVHAESNSLNVFSVNHKRTFCYISDAVDAICMLAESKNSIGEVYNIGNDFEEVSMYTLANKLMNIINKKLEIIPQPSTPGSPERRCPSIKKLTRDTPYKSRFSLSRGLTETFNWYKEKIFSGKERSAK